MSKPKTKASGFSLLELVLVVTILVALAGIIVGLFDLNIATPAGDKSPQQIVSETNLRHLGAVITGSKERTGVWSDLGQKPFFFIRSLNDLFLDLGSLQNSYSVSGEFDGLSEFDPVLKLGWRGPYLTDRPAIMDAWGETIVLQVDFNQDGSIDSDEANYARLVSPGRNRILETPISTTDMIPGSAAGSQLSLDECGDDLVFFLFVSDLRE